MYIVKEKDLIGELKEFPIEVVQKMVERQEEQFGSAKITSFQDVSASGFMWSSTEEGHKFWKSVIDYHNFDVFFKKYPKLDWKVYCRGNSSRREEVIELLKKHGGKATSFVSAGDGSYCYISPNTHKIEETYFVGYLKFLKEFYTEIFLPENDKIIEIDGKRYRKEDVLNRLSELKEVNNE